MINPTGEVRRVADAILDRILGGAYPAGLRLPAESALAEELACGRSTIREALRHLADMGLVRSRRGSGAMVLDFRLEGTPALMPAYLRLGKLDTPAHVLATELLHMRTSMAAEAVRLAASYARPEALAPAREHLAAAVALEADPAAHALNELALYRSLVVASGILPATWLINALWHPMRELNRMFAPALGGVPEGFQKTMGDILAHIEAGDAEAAVARVHAWFAAIDARLVTLIRRTFNA